MEFSNSKKMMMLKETPVMSQNFEQFLENTVYDKS
jgi:hypothetical protein